MIKCFKVQLLPNNTQQTRLFQYAGAARFAYNWALSQERDNHQSGNKFISEGDLRKAFTILRNSTDYRWLQSISNNVTKQAIKDACGAYQKFFNKQANFPKFKSRKHSKMAFFQDPIKLKFTATHVKLEGIARCIRKNRRKLNFVRLAEHNRIPIGVKYYNPRITFDGLHWWISVGIEVPERQVSLNSTGMGIDLGIKDLAVCSDGTAYKNINKSNEIKRLEKRKHRIQRSISRKYIKNKKGESYCKTSNIKKSEKLLLKVTRRLTNIRENYLHQVTTEITNRKPRFVAIEDLNVGGMMKNRHLSKSIQDQGFHRFRCYMEYKCVERGIPIVAVDRWYPSSKLCSCCGNVKSDLKLSDRTYRCNICGNTIDRDFQAALNIKTYGEQMLI